jgi:hypothetical protein
VEKDRLHFLEEEQTTALPGRQCSVLRKTLYVKPFWEQCGASEHMKKQERWSNVFNQA